MIKVLTARQINKRFAGQYVEVTMLPIWEKSKNGERLYEVHRVYSSIRENTTLGEDVGTQLEYTR